MKVFDKNGQQLMKFYDTILVSELPNMTSAELAGKITDETGTGDLVFANSPALITPTGIVKGDVGLGNIDNTSDANKPVSTAQQTALDTKSPIASPTFTGTVTLPTPFTLGAVSVLPTGTELNFVDGVTSAIQTQIDTKSPIASPTFTGEVTIPNTGLHLLDTNASHDLIVAPGSDLTADRTLTITTGDSNRTITLGGNPTLNDWFDQAVKEASSPIFAGIGVTGLPIYANNAAAVAGGLNAGAFYRTNADPDPVCVVH